MYGVKKCTSTSNPPQASLAIYRAGIEDSNLMMQLSAILQSKGHLRIHHQVSAAAAAVSTINV